MPIDYQHIFCYIKAKNTLNITILLILGVQV